MFPKRLVTGYKCFLQGRFEDERSRYKSLAITGQQPEIMVISCCDSRVSPEVIFDAQPGELFVVRNVANLVPPYETNGGLHGTSAALEFAVEVLNVKHIIVLGHECCGGIRAFVEKKSPLSSGDFIGKWIDLIAPANDTLDSQYKQDADTHIAQLEFASICQSLANLMTFGMVRRRVEQGTLQLHAAYFEITTGQLLVRDEKTRLFKEI